MQEVCPTCKQKLQHSHKEMLTKSKLIMLQRAAKYVMHTMKNDFMVKDIAAPEEFKTYNNFSKLRFHGLVYRVKDKPKGHWLITRNGWAFLRGELSLPKYVLVKQNHITSKADLEISVRDVYYGSDILQTVFQYFSDDGKPVGWGPTMRSPLYEQMGLRI